MAEPVRVAEVPVFTSTDVRNINDALRNELARQITELLADKCLCGECAIRAITIVRGI